MCTSFITLGPRSAPPPASLVALGSPRTPISCYAPSPSKQTLPCLWPLSATFGSSSSFLPVPSCVTQAGSFLSRRPFVPISLPVPLLERLPSSIHPVRFAPGHPLPCSSIRNGTSLLQASLRPAVLVGSFKNFLVQRHRLLSTASTSTHTHPARRRSPPPLSPSTTMQDAGAGPSGSSGMYAGESSGGEDGAKGLKEWWGRFKAGNRAPAARSVPRPSSKGKEPSTTGGSPFRLSSRSLRS